MNFRKSIIVLLSGIFMCACSPDGSEIPIYMVERGDFQYVLKIDGVVEPVSFENIVCPQRVDGFITYIVDDGTWVEKGDTLCVIEDVNLESQYESILLRLEEVEMELAKTMVSYEMDNALLESQLLTNEAEAQLAQLDSLQLKYLPASQRRIKELDLAIVALQRKKLEEKFKLTPVIQKTQLNRYNVELNNIRRQLDDVKTRLDALVILAPKKGLAIKAESPYSWDKLKVGDNVWNGYTVVIMPDMEEMKVKIFAPEGDYNAMNEGDSIVYMFDAIPGGMGFGKIVKKSRTWKPVTRGSNVKLYDVEASLDSVSVMPEPGFTAVCNIMVQQMKDTLFIPQVALFNEDSVKTVFVKNDKKGFEMRQVVTGLSSNKEVVIAAGLNGGEQIALIRPRDNEIRNRVMLPDSIVQKYESSLDGPTVDSDQSDGEDSDGTTQGNKINITIN